eukprot:TRINITY_DN710_c0_g1_i4.p1 TRINITY_DN710_c0_g1~~TRINITY_DN710_c0_g1_i4.p1  ORF type:complete len:1221 (-),score=179.58 TRINITY_DN710_c0_g1_i4:146-3808(-)
MFFILFFAFLGLSYSQTCIGVSGNIVQGCRNAFTDESQFWTFSTDHNFVPPLYPGKTIVGPGSKLLFDFKTTPNLSPGFWFADMTLYPSHTNLIAALGVSADSTYWRCDFQSYVLPDGSYLFAFTYNIGAAITPAMMNGTCRVAADHIPIRNRTKVGFVSMDSTQAITEPSRAYCESRGFVMYTADQVLNQGGADTFIPLHKGITYGNLRQFPVSTSLLANTDIPVFNQLPLDLAVVAGVITSVFQTVNSHINLKSNERDTPNMILLNYDKIPCIQTFLNKPIKLTVASYGWSIEKSTLEEVRNKTELRTIEKKWLSLYHDTFNEIQSYDQMCEPDDPIGCLLKKKIYGTKASSLGFLRNKNVLGTALDNNSLSYSLGYDLSPIGFGLPFQFYVDFVNYPPNAYIKTLVSDLTKMETEREPLPIERLNISTLLKKAFWEATVPPHILNAIVKAVDLYLTPNKVNQVKFRSSSNAEDLPGFDGAGLYDSFSADVGSKTPKNVSSTCYYDQSLDDMVPSTIECALKGVYGSLWNQRAIEERTFARYKHETCVMGISVVPRYKELGKSVTANSVAITRLIDGSTDRAGYTFSIQKDDNDVTNPDPNTVSETTVAYINTNKTWTWLTTRFATPVAGQPPLTAPVLTRDLMDKMMLTILRAEEAYCLYKFNLTKEKCSNMMLNNVKTGLDIEFKFIDNQRVHCKQLREFAGTKDTTNIITNSSCGYIDPSYFAPINGVKYNNVAKGKPVNSFNTLTVTTTMAYGGVRVTVSGYASKANDGLVEVSDGSVTMTNQWWEVSFDVPYTVHYIRIFWCNTQVGGNSYSYPSFTLGFTTNNQLVTRSFSATTSAIQLLNVTAIANTTKVRMTVTTSYICMAEFQILALPYRTGDVSDFIPEKRFNTEDCVWDAWKSWSECSAPCAGGVQNRTRGGTWCVNYVVYDVFSQTQTCNNHTCPVDCSWNDWSSWTPCSGCKWSSRNRTYVPPIAAGKDCVGPHTERIECIRNGVACLSAPPVVFLVTVIDTSSTNLDVVSSEIKSTLSQSLNVDESIMNVYLSSSNDNINLGNVVVMVTFNDESNTTGQAYPLSHQNELAQNCSKNIVSDPIVANYFTRNAMKPVSLTLPDIISYGVGFGVTPSPAPFYSTPVSEPSLSPSQPQSSDIPTSPGSPSVAPGSPGGGNTVGTEGSGDSSSIPFWAWILVGVGACILVGGVILLVVYKVCLKGNEIV